MLVFPLAIICYSDQIFQALMFELQGPADITLHEQPRVLRRMFVFNREN